MGVWDFVWARETAFGLGTPDHHNRGMGPYRFDYAARDAALRWWRCGGGARLRWRIGSRLRRKQPTDRPTDRTGGGRGRATGGPADRRTGRTRATSEGVALAGLACGPGAGRDPRPFLKPHVEKERGSVPAPTIYMYHGALNMQGPAARILSSSLVNIHAENRASCSCML